MKRVIFFILIWNIHVGTHSNACSETINFLVWEGYVPHKFLHDFDKEIKRKFKKDIDFKVSYISDPTEFFHRLRGGDAHIISPTHNLIKDKRFDLIAKGLILPVNRKNIPNLKSVKKELRNPSYMTFRNRLYGIPFNIGIYGLAYNAAKVPEPDSWDILWDKKNIRKYTLSRDYYEVNIYITALAMGYKQEDIFKYNKLNTPMFRKRLCGLAKNAHNLWVGVDKPKNFSNMNYGAVWGFSIPALNKKGNNWKIASPKEGSMMWIDNFCIGASLKNRPTLKRIAEEWLNYTLSYKYQREVVLKKIGATPVNTDVNRDNANNNQETGPVGEKRLWPTIKNSRDRNGMELLWKKCVAKTKD